MDNEIEILLDRSAELIVGAASILFITGAGISADSGLPTYRGLGGLYNDKHTEEGIPIEEALSSGVMALRPDITWKYLWQIGSCCIKAEPNSAHKIITNIQKAKPDTWVLTQNIDSLHKKAGNINLIEIHGNAFELSCTGCSYKSSAQELLYGTEKTPELPPVCPECGSVIRPDVVLFGEMLPVKAMELYYKILDRRPALIISIGTSGMFPYINAPVLNARYYGGKTIDINPHFSSITESVDIHLKLGGAAAMEEIWKRLEPNPDFQKRFTAE